MVMKARSDWLLKLVLSFAIRLAKLFTSIYKTPTGSTAEFRVTSPVSPATETKDPPPKSNVSIAVTPSGIVLSWYMTLEERHAPIMN